MNDLLPLDIPWQDGLILEQIVSANSPVIRSFARPLPRHILDWQLPHRFLKLNSRSTLVCYRDVCSRWLNYWIMQMAGPPIFTFLLVAADVCTHPNFHWWSEQSAPVIIAARPVAYLRCCRSNGWTVSGAPQRRRLSLISRPQIGPVWFSNWPMRACRLAAHVKLRIRPWARWLVDLLSEYVLTSSHLWLCLGRDGDS
jgi:hypothetical protein